MKKTHVISISKGRKATFYDFNPPDEWCDNPREAVHYKFRLIAEAKRISIAKEMTQEYGGLFLDNYRSLKINKFKRNGKHFHVH